MRQQESERARVGGGRGRALERERKVAARDYAGLAVVRCQECERPIATTAVDQAKGAPPILLDWPENATGWTCTECAGVFR